TGALAPAMLRAVLVGKHEVEARTDCARAKAAVTIAVSVITRAELTPVDGKGTLAVAGTPAAARVHLDDIDMGKLPATYKDVTCGDHVVAVRADGFLEDRRTVRVAAFETTTVTVALNKEEFGTLVVDVTPLETAVAVDGIDIGAGPRTIERVATGPHEVSGVAPGFMRQLQAVDIQPNAVTRVNMLLLPEAAATTKTRAGPTPLPANTGRLVLNSVVTAVSLGGTAYGVVRFLDANEAFARYLTVPSDVAAEAIYTQEVIPARTGAFISGGVGIAGLISSGVLWYTTKF
ncbi:MAG: PEGA domain-containing protein, partial [Pseudomonadota bacterium]|nr:PEGA domain-containing protein [Pseudomonadota bacterium]